MTLPMRSHRARPSCIYCPNEADSEEHVFPAALGRFPLFDTSKPLLCVDCNNELGRQLIQPLTQRGVYSLMRQELPGQVGRRRRGRKRREGDRYELPRAYLPEWGRDVLLEYEEKPGHGGPARSLLLNCKGEDVLWRVPEHVQTAEDLLRELQRAGHGECTPSRFVHREGDTFPAILGAAFPNMKLTFGDSVEPGRKFAASLLEPITPRMRRAMAMLVLHMYLRTHADAPTKREYEELRRFIKSGQQSMNLVAAITKPAFSQQFCRVVDGCPSHKKHVLLFIPTTGGDMLGALCLFFNGSADTPWWIVKLSSGLRVLRFTKGYALAYDPSPPVRVGGAEKDGRTLTLRFPAATAVIPAYDAIETDC